MKKKVLRKYRNTFEELEVTGLFQRLQSGELTTKDYTTISETISKIEQLEYYYDQLFTKLMPLINNKQLELPNSVLDTLNIVVKHFLDFQALPKPKLPILCLDFDGVIHSYTSGWVSPTTIQDEPIKGALDFIVQAQSAFSVHIFSSRSHCAGGVEAMEKWMIFHLSKDHAKDEVYKIMNKIVFSRIKPSAMITIDDRALTFTGTWPRIVDLKNFKTWQQ